MCWCPVFYTLSLCVSAARNGQQRIDANRTLKSDVQCACHVYLSGSAQHHYGNNNNNNNNNNNWKNGRCVTCDVTVTDTLIQSYQPAAAEREMANCGQLAQSYTFICPNSITSILLKTCLKPGFRQVLSIKKSETWSPTCLRPGLRQVVRLVVRQVVRQDRSNGIWAIPVVVETLGPISNARLEFLNSQRPRKAHFSSV